MGTGRIGGDKCEEAEKCPHCYCMQDAYFSAIVSYRVLYNGEDIRKIGLD
ncbi:hypothetical protein MC28_F095 (plasmid) [Bacillus thuringiensis MC28]|nr:hypothetical protein MC28_F095 [Bacillus thuringiensis MC28]